MSESLMWIISGSIGGFILITVLPYLFYIKWKMDKDKKRKENNFNKKKKI